MKEPILNAIPTLLIRHEWQEESLNALNSGIFAIFAIIGAAGSLFAGEFRVIIINEHCRGSRRAFTLSDAVATRAAFAEAVAVAGFP